MGKHAGAGKHAGKGTIKAVTWMHWLRTSKALFRNMDERTGEKVTWMH